MTGPRILVIGAGSIGSRHAGNLAALGADVTVADPDEARAARIDGARVAPGEPEDVIAGGFDGVVVASPTSLHAQHLRAALATPACVMVEKPLATTATEIGPDLDLARVMVGYNLRLVPAVAHAVQLVLDGRVGRPSSVRAWFGSWLPGWRPGVDYRTTYSARRSLGGGVLLDAIHELDLLVWLAGDGDFSVVGALVARLGDLEIDAEDTVKAVLRHRDGLVAELSLDYLARRYRRGLEVVGSEATLLLDWETASLRVSDGTTTSSHPADLDLVSAYVEEARRFLGFLEGGTPPVDGPSGLQSLLLADRIRAAGR